MAARESVLAGICALGLAPVGALAQEQGGQGDARQAPLKQPIRAPQGLGVWLIGVHPMAQDPDQQVVAHHLCQQLMPDLMQCALYSSNQPDARLTGIEYIVPGERFAQLPEDEKQYWHPHNFEILSGTLVAPEVADDMKILAGKLNSYGKTFHMWMTGTVTGEPQDFPYGPPMLAWSLNEEGQLAPELKQTYRDMGLDLEALQEERRSYAERAEPQCGVNALDGQFARETSPIQGVAAREQGCPDYPFATGTREQ